ncbi:unnamed protein product [Miscanthus lutarioriparius]|uniref:Uncharacterized protein n=1 Tax=Miscanthus lutarioriparius TaxID=422564 RepID=A0A811QCZ8_9POAL|nr:unnamed protein product [Miscanthus lutarioriparius]
MKQNKTFVDALNETSKGDYSIKKCMDLLESIEELSDEEKAQATSIMKCEVNREIFINFTNPRVRLLWIKGSFYYNDDISASCGNMLCSGLMNPRVRLRWIKGDIAPKYYEKYMAL